MNSDKYLEWCVVPNTVSSRLKDNSLFHTLTREKRIRKSTKLVNQTFERKFGKKTYAQYRQSKQKILKQLSENIDVIDKSGFSDNYYKSYYDSFDTSITNLQADDFLWNNVNKKGRDQDEPQVSFEEPSYFWEPDVNINVIKTNKDFENTHNISKIRKRVQTIENKNSTKKEATPKSLIKSKNTSMNSTNISNKEVSSVNRKGTLRKSASVKQSPKSKQVTNKRSKDVKKNLTTALDNVSLRFQEFAGDEWNEDFAAAEFQAQSTQIFSDTFSDKKAKSKHSVDLKLSHEVMNQPRDSGIEEDSREDNTKFENHVNGQKCSKKDEHEKDNESEAFKEQNINNLKDVDNNLHQNEVKKSPCKKVPLKIIGEEKVTQKFKIITNKDQESKAAEEEKKVELSKIKSSGSNSSNSTNVNPTKEKSESSSESDSEFADCQNADHSQFHKSDQDSSDEYYDLQDNGESDDNKNENKNENDSRHNDREGDSEDSQNENKIENDLRNGRKVDSENSQNEHENEKAESDNSSMNESIMDKKKLKERLKRCKSPYMLMRYNRLKKSGVLEESDVEPQIQLITNSKEKLEKTLITPSKSSKTKKINQLKAARLLDTPKTQKQVNNNELFEEKTLVAENFNDDSLLINELKENGKDIEDNMEEATPNIAKLQQRKRLSSLADNNESEDSEGESTHRNAKDKAKNENNTKSPNSKHIQHQMKGLHSLNSVQDSDESEIESKNNEANKKAYNLNISDTKIEITDSSEIRNLQNLSKSKKDNSDSTVSETTNSQSSLKSEQANKKKDKIQKHKRLPDKEISSAGEASVEISTQKDLKNVVKLYKETLLSKTSQLPEDLIESNEPSIIIGTQFQPSERPVHEDSDDSENSEVEKTVIKVNNQSEIQEQESISDSEKEDGSLKNESHKINKIKQKEMILKESSSREDSSDLEEMGIDSSNTNINKNEDCEDEWIMSSKSKENLNKFKRLDLLNSDEDSDDSQDDIVEKSHCNSDVDTGKRKTENILLHDDSQKKVSLNQLKSSDCDSSDKSESELPSVCKNNKSTSKPLSSKFDSFNDSGAVPVIDDKSLNRCKSKSPRKRKFTQIDSVEANDRESGSSQEIDVVHYSSENDTNDKKKNKKSKSSNVSKNMLAEEENIDSLSANSIKHTQLDSILSENESDASDSDHAMSYSSKQKIMRLKKINLLANNSSSSSSSSEDEENIESSQNHWQKDRKKGAASKNSSLKDPESSDSNSDSEKKNNLHKIDAEININQNQVEENEELIEENDKNSFKDQNDDIFDDKNSNCKDSEEESTMSSKTKERLNKMKRLDLLNSDNDSDDSKESNEFKNDCNSDVDIEEHKIKDIVKQHSTKKNNETLENQISLNDPDPEEKNVSSKSKTKTENSTREKLLNEKEKNNEITSNKSSKLTSRLVPDSATDSTQGDNAFEKEKVGSKESKKRKKKEIIQETQESAHSQEHILESQPMFSSLEDLREGIDEKQLNFEVDSDVNANSIADVSKISSTKAPTKMIMDKITKISELVEKESLEKLACQSTLSVNSISPDEDIFVLEVPRTIFKENLVGKKFSFLKTTLTVGSNNYEAFQKQVSPTYSCVLKSEKKALDSFITQNIRPVATIVARRKKFVDESAKASNNEVEENHEFSCDNEIKNLCNGNSLKNKSPKMKVAKKVVKRTKKSEEKEVLQSSVKSNKKETVTSKNITTKNIFDIKNFTKKTPKVSTTDSPKKRSKKLQQKVHTDEVLSNDEIAKGENLDNNNLSSFLEEAHIQTAEKKAEKTNEAVNISVLKDNILKKPVKSPGKMKKMKVPVDVKKSKDVKVPEKMKSTEPVETLAKSESKSLAKKRKAESQPSEDANPDENQTTRKKKKVATEKKEKKPTSKAVKPRNPKKKSVSESGESAADQIRKLIAKNIKFDDSLNRSYDPSNYNPLDVKRVSKKPKRCQSTTSSSSDDDSKFKRSSFHVRVKSKPEDNKSTDAFSDDVKKEEKKTVKKIFFAE